MMGDNSLNNFEFFIPSFRCFHVSFSDVVLAIFKLEMRNSRYQMGLPVLIVYYVW